jgi:hypothetical protein
MRVFVYFNLHRKLFSVKALEGENRGRVISHCDEIYLENVSFRVSEAGRQRVLKEGRKNVHAGVAGEWVQDGPTAATGQAITYNPYRYASFVVKSTLEPVFKAQQAWLKNRTITAK